MQGVFLSTASTVYLLGVTLSTSSSVGVQGISLSIKRIMNVHGVSLHTASCVDVQGVSFSTLVQFFMPERQTVRHLIIPVPEWKRIFMLEPARYRNKETQFGTGIGMYAVGMIWNVEQNNTETSWLVEQK